MKNTGRILTLAGVSALLSLTSLSAFAHDTHEPAQAKAVTSSPVTGSVVTLNAALTHAVNSDFRTTANKSRDQYRHPEQTLGFFEVKPTDTVVELWPGSGWYTEILAPYLADKGHYVAAGFETEPKLDNPTSAYFAKSGKAYQAWLLENKAALGPVTSLVLDPPRSLFLGQPASADVVLTFRNLHNWAMQGELEGVLVAAYEVLKAGGTFGVIEHRATKGMKPESGYMEQAAMVALAEKAGFVLVASSEINANPKDTKDYPKGVWSLPPRLALGEVDKDKYLAIGESDRMTLKFIKPQLQ